MNKHYKLFNEEIESYIRLDSMEFKLPVDIYLDEMNTHKSYKHKTIAFFRNSYDTNSRNFIPIVVSENPSIIPIKNIQISSDDVDVILKWIEKYNKLIIDLSEEKIDFIQFFANVVDKKALLKYPRLVSLLNQKCLTET